MENEKYNKLAKWVIFLTSLVYILPYLLNGHNAYIRLHDNLEGEWVWLKILVDSKTAFTLHPFIPVPEVMNGVPRSVFPSLFSVNMVLVQLFGMFYGYLISNILVRIIGFIGMSLLLKTYFSKERENQFIVWLCAVTFAILPVFIPFGISLMGQPLLLWAFLNLHQRKQLKLSYLLIVSFPFYSSVVWLLFPFTLVFGLLAIHYIRYKSINRHYIGGFLLLTFMFILVNLPIITNAVIKGDFIPHRQAYNLYMFGGPDFVSALGEAVLLMFASHYHVATFLANACFIAVLLMVRKRYPLITTLFFGIIAICLFQGFYTYLEYWWADKFVFMKSFRINRFSMLVPFLWLFAFALSLFRMRSSEALKPLVLPFLLAQLVVALFGNDELLQNYRIVTGHQKFPGYENYLAPKQFEEIKQYINQPVSSYRVASLGMSPSVAQYHGFYTLDGLMSVYDQRYKQQFREIFAGEIAESNDIAQYFDGWGNRCYIFSSELGMHYDAYNHYKFTPRSVSGFDFNAKAFSSMGGEYLLSAVEIKNADAVQLHLEKVFNDEQSWWTVYLYSIKAQP